MANVDEPVGLPESEVPDRGGGASGRARTSGRARRRVRRRISPHRAREGQGGRERSPARHRGDDPDLDPVRVPRLEVPDRRQPRQPARPGCGLQPAGDGAGLRPAPRRDRPLGRVRRRPRRGDHGRPREPGPRLALVYGNPGRAPRLRGNRRAPGNDHHADRPALVRRHARRPPLLAGGTPEDPRRRRDDPDPGRHDQQHRERQHQPARGLDPHACARRGVRPDPLAARLEATACRPRRPAAGGNPPEDRRSAGGRRRARPALQPRPRHPRADQGRPMGRAPRGRRGWSSGRSCSVERRWVATCMRSAATPRPRAGQA